MVKETETEVEAKSEKRKVAEHELIDAKGTVVDTEEEARGIRYTLLENSQSFQWVADEATDAELVMLAIFGAKTLATNERSQSKNEGADGAIQAVRDRFGLIRSGQWVDRTREGAGVPRVDKDALAEAICKVQVAMGKKTQAEVDNGHKAAVRQKLEEDVQFLRKSRQVPQVLQAYTEIVGKATASIDDLDI